MSTCDTCPKPGACCSGFALAHINGDWLGSRAGWDDDVVNAFLEKEGLPFVVRDRVTAETNQYIRVACTWLTSTGRCGNYLQRPNLCRAYEPEQNMLCVRNAGFAERDDLHLLGPENFKAVVRYELTDVEWAAKYAKLFGDRDTTPTEFDIPAEAEGIPGTAAL